MRKRLLITGATGFLGTELLRCFHDNSAEWDIWATSDRPQPPKIQTGQYHQLDLLDFDRVCDLVSASKPSHVIHVAGLVGRATLEKHLLVNVVGTENLYKALMQLDTYREIRIVQAGSAAAYGWIKNDDLPITEQQPFRPLTRYLLSYSLAIKFPVPKLLAVSNPETVVES